MQRSRMPARLRKFFFAMLVLTTLWGCGLGSPQRPSTPTISISTPTPRAYPVDIPGTGIRVWSLPTWQAWVPEMTEGEENRPQVYLLPLLEEDDEETPFVTAPSTMEDVLFEPPYILLTAYPLPQGRPFQGREVYFALEEIVLPPGVEIEVGAIEPVRTPRGQAWTAPLTLTMSGGEGYEGRITLVNSPYGMVLVAVGLAPQGEWPSFEQAYWRMVNNVSFSQPPPSPTPSS